MGARGLIKNLVGEKLALENIKLHSLSPAWVLFPASMGKSTMILFYEGTSKS